ncbi:MULTISPECIES: glycosyltransferase [Rahnella]|jgi:glycosyltransferase involved in cell wall biosynthesis|uniref:Glycosyltransferase n=1 Tax=Rahnella sp. (strain Y9602) TaxID=2703885 RepID=A0ABW6CD54_RAHSY|nr:glycosyltransferase [Rahnella aceris]MDP9703387.1 glycosyltransferase involved in cell wall biosynthesis [Rahnella aquatilis]
MNNVVMFTRSLPMHGLGGMEVVAWDIAKGLHRLGSNVRIITTKTPDYVGLHHIDGIEVLFIDNVKSGKYSHGWWKSSREAFEENYIKDCDTVFSVSTGAYGVIDLKHKNPHIKFLIQVHGTAWGEFISKLKTKTPKGFLTSPKNIFWLCRDFINYNKFDYIVGIGEQVYGDFNRWPYESFIDKNKISLISNGIDSELFKSDCCDDNKIKDYYNIPYEKKVILTACRLHSQKGVYNCIKTIELLNDKNEFVYIIVGSGPEEQKLKSLVNSLGANDYIKFLGSLKREDLAKVESISDVFLFLTNRIEGLPLNILEASAVGVPIVLSNQVKLFKSGNIHLVDPLNYQVAASKIESLLAKDLQNKNSYLPDEYTLKYAADKYKKLIEKSF